MARDRAGRPEAKPLRLFVAVDIPEEAKALAEEAVAPWRERFPKARWVPSENWHVTLKFLGSTWPRLVDWVSETVAAVAAARGPFDVSLDGLGSFPSARRARVVWVGMTDPSGGLAALAGALQEALAKEFEPEKRAFAAHLTVARSDPPLTLPEEFAATVLRSDPFPIDRLVIYRSHLQRPAPLYEPLQLFPLTGGDG